MPARAATGTLPWRSAVVTGASSGIGRALAERLARAGVRVLMCARDRSRLDDAAAAVAGAVPGAQVRTLAFDVRDSARTVDALRAADDDERALTGGAQGYELVIANAGRAILAQPGAPLLEWEAVSTMCRLNFEGALATLLALLPRMIERERGHLVGVSSLAALGPVLPGTAAYAAGKVALTTFLAGLRVELAGTGVDVTAVHPGSVRTPTMPPAPWPTPFLAEPDDVAARILRALPAAPARIDFPLSLVALAKASALLPRPLRDVIMRRSARALGGGDAGE